MRIKLFNSKTKASAAAALQAAKIISTAIKSRGQAAIVLASGKSQLPFLKYLVSCAKTNPKIDWSKVTIFHLDEYLGLKPNHPVSMRHFLEQNFLTKINPARIYPINGQANNPRQECGRLNRLISNYAIDVAFLGIGLNGHLAFNDPPADFRTKLPYRVVDLDQTNRHQQVKEGWFSKLSYVPKQAISMTIPQILKSKQIICLAFGKKKAGIVRKSFAGGISPLVPASILQTHKSAVIYLDKNSASSL